MPPAAYYVRYGAMRQVGRFAIEGGVACRRGDVVVVRSRRGEELGEVVGACPEEPTAAAIVRVASGADREQARRVAADRPRRLAACDGFFRDGRWPIEPIDAEPMLDGDRTVLLYLGPHRLDTAALAQALKAASGLDVVFEPVGLDEADEEASSCGSCGEGGGCGDGGCGSGHDGCSSCAVKDLVRARGAVLAR